jgi:predicted lipoprotein
MDNKVVRYAIRVTVLLIVGYYSLYFRSLSEVKASSTTKAFDGAAYAKRYWIEKILPAQTAAVDLSELLKQLREDPGKAIQDYCHALGIGNIRYCMVKGEGEVTLVDENDVTVHATSGSVQTSARLATEFIYGNAVRDAVGGIDLSEFTNTANLNDVAAEINKIIREEIIPPFKAKVERGVTVQYVGAIELNQNYPDLTDVEIIPVSITIMNK